MQKGPIYLASSSPRRRELLAQLGYQFTIITPDVEELRQPDESAADYVLRLSRQKAQAGTELVADCSVGAVVIGADTIVVSDGDVLEKPHDLPHARQMLQTLSAGRHQVMTAVTVADSQHWLSELVVTDVWFKALSEEEITDYWATGEPFDKAGAYGIQGIGGRFVSRIEGSYHAVVGLPLLETDQLLLKFWKSYKGRT
jgi:septum formation protein